VADVDDLVLLGQAQLTLAGEVDEHAEHGEDLVVLGPGGAEREWVGLAPGDGRVLLEHGDDLAPVDPAVLVDVVDEGLGDLLRVAEGVVDEVLDRGEVDESDPDLDRVLGDALRGRRAGGA
jgi:hypothetical protein